MCRVHVVDCEGCRGDSVCDERLLERLGRWVLVRLEEQFDSVRGVGSDDGQPPELTDRDVCFVTKPSLSV